MRQKETNVSADNDKPDFRRTLPESWQCIDCGRNTAPGMQYGTGRKPPADKNRFKKSLAIT